MRRALLIALLLALPLGAGCRAVSDFFDNDPHPVSQAEHGNAQLYLEIAEQELAEGRLERALDRLVAIRDLPNLPPETRLASEGLIDRCAAALLARDDADIDALEDLYSRTLSQRMSARVGIRLAERLYEEGYRVSAWRQVRDVEQDHPNHTERAAAGDVLARVGADLIRDTGRYWLVMSYQARGIAALEYLVQTYPMNPACPGAYALLAEIYDERGDLDLAIERNEDLVLYHGGGPEAVRAEILIPHLRLKRLERADYDRGEMVIARREARNWLRRHPNDPLRDWAETVEREALAILCDSDLLLARYYERVDNPFGARLHASRALSEAVEAGDEERAKRARATLADIEGAPPLARAEPEDPLGSEGTR